MSESKTSGRGYVRMMKLLRFRLRTLLILVVISTVLFAWIGTDLIRASIQRPVVAEIQAAGGRVGYDYQSQSGFVRLDTDPPGSKIVRSIFGDDIHAAVTSVFFLDLQTSDIDVQPLYKLPDLQDVMLYGPNVTDECIDDLLKIRRLRGLNLGHTSISEVGLAKLASSQQLQHLSLSGDNVTDLHLAEIPDFSGLQSLQISQAKISNEGLKAIGNTPTLNQLDIYRCGGVTDEGILSLSRLVHLKQFEVIGASLTDASMESIAKMSKLRTLRLEGGISDEGIGQISSLEVDPNIRTTSALGLDRKSDAF